MSNVIIDVHSHLDPRGGAYGGAPGKTIDLNPQVYLGQAAGVGITHVIAAPGPCPEFPLPGQTDLGFRPCRWIYDNVAGNFRFEQQLYELKSGNILEHQPATENPYGEINRTLLDFAAGNNRSGSGPKVLVMPLIHLQLDTPEEIRELASHPLTAALKIHGLGSASCPSDLLNNRELLRAMVATNKPLTIHTDTLSREARKPLETLWIANQPKGWIDLALAYGIKMFLAHGVRLDLNQISRICGLQQFLTGTAPGLMITASDSERLSSGTKNFEYDVLRLAGPANTAFDVDFKWNVTGRDALTRTAQETEIQDWGGRERMEFLMNNALGWSLSQQQAFFSGNAERFYSLEKFSV